MRRITVAGVRSRASRARAALRSVRAVAQDRLDSRHSGSPLDFAAWADRRLARSDGFPSAWRSYGGVPFESPSRVCVLLHAYYPELVSDLLAGLAALPVEFDLIVTNATGDSLQVDASSLPNLRNHAVLEVENRGRDIWPMIQVVNSGALDPYDLVLKIHTKQSGWRAAHDTLGGTGEQWRVALTEALLGERNNVETILSAFAEDPNLGIVTAAGNIVGPEHWGADLANTTELLRRLELAVDPGSLRFPAGSFYWARGFVLQGLRALQMSDADFEDEPAPIDGTSAHAVERAIGLLATEAGLRMSTRTELAVRDVSGWRRYLATAPRHRRARVIPFYLPQFHATVENDQWWGRGFTEWVNVTAARPVYLGHNQPNLPADLGFYDLRLDEVRQAQLDLAAVHGVEGFMYYYYWFAGRRLLNMPIDKLLASEINKPFCIMWANENWTRRWDGRDADILMGQDYERVPASEFIDDVLPFLRDPRYMCVDGKPVLAVYRIAQLPDCRAVLAEWRERASAAGLEGLTILSVDVAREFDGLSGDPAEVGADATLGFPPHNLRWDWVPHGGLHVDPRFRGNLLSYSSMVKDAERRMLRQRATAYPGVMVNFDNTARRQWEPDLWVGANPYTFRRWLAAACSSIAHRDPAHRMVFVNAWNEWAEGAVLEPSRRFGRSYLHAVRDVVYG